MLFWAIMGIAFGYTLLVEGIKGDNYQVGGVPAWRAPWLPLVDVLTGGTGGQYVDSGQSLQPPTPPAKTNPNQPGGPDTFAGSPAPHDPGATETLNGVVYHPAKDAAGNWVWKFSHIITSPPTSTTAAGQPKPTLSAGVLARLFTPAPPDPGAKLTIGGVVLTPQRIGTSNQYQWVLANQPVLNPSPHGVY